MSITAVLDKNRYVKKLKELAFLREFFEREFREGCQVYFPYRIRLKHPFFAEILSRQPCPYVNKHRARLLHLINGVGYSDGTRLHIIELIDHPLSPIAKHLKMRSSEPIDYVQNIDIAKEIYSCENLKKVIVPSSGHIDVFKHYFGVELAKKLIVIPVSQPNRISVGKKPIVKQKNFLCIASHFYGKGVEIILRAWSEFMAKGVEATLMLVSHDMPDKFEHTLPSNVKLIRDIPLSVEQKNRLYAEADVLIATTLTDGGGGLEGVSYGKPIILFDFVFAKDMINCENGIIIDVPYSFYDAKSYGEKWRSFIEFLELIKNSILNGEFDATIRSLAHTFARYCEDDSFLLAQSENAVKKYYKDVTIEPRNKKLNDIYSDILGKI